MGRLNTVKKFYKLCNFQFMNMFFKASLVCIGLLALQITAFENQNYDDFGIRLEQLMQRAGFSTIFLIAYIILLVVIVISIYQRYFGSKSMYTMMTLPVSRAALYWSFILPAVIMVLMLCFTQIVSVSICYQIILSKAHSLSSDPYMNNALFLAFVRYDYLRVLFPLNFFDLARSVSLLVVPVVTAVYAAFSERSRQYWNFVFILVQLYFIWSIATVDYQSSDPATFYTDLCFSCVITAAFAFHSYKMLARKSVV